MTGFTAKVMVEVRKDVAAEGTVQVASAPDGSGAGRVRGSGPRCRGPHAARARRPSKTTHWLQRCCNRALCVPPRARRPLHRPAPAPGGGLGSTRRLSLPARRPPARAVAVDRVCYPTAPALISLHNCGGGLRRRGAAKPRPARHDCAAARGGQGGRAAAPRFVQGRGPEAADPEPAQELQAYGQRQPAKCNEVRIYDLARRDSDLNTIKTGQLEF